MKKIVVIFPIIAFFCYLYPVKFTFLPFLNTRYIISIIGFVVLYNSNRITLPKPLMAPLGCLVFLALFGSFSTIVNGAFDFTIAFIPFTFLLTYYSFVGLERISGGLTLEKFTFFLTIAALIQVSISVIFFIIPGVEDFIGNFIYLDAKAEAAMERLEGIRLRGLGTAYFTSGVIHSIVLILIALNVNSRQLFYSLSYIIIAFIGLCMSRTLMFGVFISLFPLIKNLSNGKFYKSLLIVGILILVMVYIYNATMNSNNDDVFTIFNFGFSYFTNLIETGSIENESVTVLRDSIKLPSDFCGWIFGDGYWKDPKNPLLDSYMGVDQGYLRTVFYYGLIGLSAHLLTYWKLIKTAVFRSSCKYLYLIFVLYLIIFLKGYQNIFEFCIPLIFLSNNSSSNQIYE